MVYYITNLFSDFTSVASFVALAATVLGAVSFFLSNIARYAQAQKYGIPLKAFHQANIADSVNVWVTLIGALGFGVLLPVALLGVDTNAWLLGIAVAVGQFLALISTKSTERIIVERKGKQIPVTHIGFCLLPILSALAFVHMHNQLPSFNLSVVTVMALLGMALYLYVLGRHFLNGLSAILFGSKGGLMTVEIEGKLHLIIARSSSYHWIMLPCEHVDYKRVIKKKDGGTTNYTSKYVVFERGKFIIVDLTELSGYITQVETGYSINRTKYDMQMKKDGVVS